MKRSFSAATVLLAGVLLAPVAHAGDDMTSLSYISYLERYATIRPAHGDSTYDVVVNMPVLAGDRLDTTRGARVEVQLSDGSTLWLDEFATIDFDAVALSSDDASKRTSLFLAEGAAAIEIPATAAGDGALRFDSPAGAVFLNRPGLYRLELRGNQIRVQAHSGFAELPAGAGSEILRGGEEAVVGAESEIQRASIVDANDDFWNWVQERRHVPTGSTAQYVDSRNASRAAVLDSYGDWVYVPTFSTYMWQPHVSTGWVPYSYGRWYWTPVGWSWISYEPWGWVPFHYGSWYFDAGFGWVWGWDSVWGPAWVNWFYTPGYVGWCPRGYYDYWYYHNGHGGWHGDGHHPPHWSDASFKFAGRVKLDQMDPKPWTVVPSTNFSSLHIDRIRLDANRFLRDGQPGREGVVRSGPLVTPFPAHATIDRNVDAAFRSGPAKELLPDLSPVMRREIPTGVRAATPLPELRLTRTRDVAASFRTDVERTLHDGSGTASPDRFTAVVPGDSRSPVLLHRSDGASTASGSATARRDVVSREVIRRETVNPAGATGQPKKIDSTGTHSGIGSTVERHVAPSTTRPPSNSVSWSRGSDSAGTAHDVATFQESWATRRDLARAGTSSGSSLNSGSAQSVRSFRAPAIAERTVSVRSGSSSSISSKGTASHGSSHSGSSSHSSGGGSGHGGHRP